jgi:hypothetical protein
MTDKLHSMDGESWMSKYWQPMCAITYLTLVIFDFIIAPILLGFYSILMHSKLEMWVPLTTMGGGIIHVTFGAILGVYAYGRGKEILQCNDITASSAKEQK